MSASTAPQSPSLSTPASPPPPGNTRALVLVLCTIFLDVLGLGIIVPILPFYAESLGANSVHVGLLFTTFAVCQLLTTPILGAISDRIGRRPILLFSLAGEAAGYVVMGLATNVAMLYVSRVVTGTTAGNIGAAYAYLADITPPRDRTRIFGLMGASFGLGFALGPGLGGLLSQADIRLPAFAAAALIALNWLFSFFFLPESLPRERRVRAPITLGGLNPLAMVVALARRPPLQGPLTATFLFNFAFASFQVTFALFLAARFGLGPAEVSYLFVVLGLSGIVFQGGLVRYLSERFADTHILLAGLVIQAGSYLATSLAPSVPWLWATMLFLSLGSSLSRAPLSSLISTRTGPREQGLANGGAQSTGSLGLVLGPIWGGLVFEHVGLASPFWTGALILLLAALAVVVGNRYVPAPRLAPAHD